MKAENLRNYSWGIAYLILTTFILFGVGCLPDSADQNAENNQSHGLPTALDDANCEMESPPHPCTWMKSNDAVFTAEVEEITALTDQVIVAHSDHDRHEIVDSCDGPVNNGLELKLLIEEVISGDAVESGDSITVLIGFGQLQSWNPFPAAWNGGIWWQGDGDGKIEEGNSLGFGVRHHPEYDEWSLMGAPLFQITESDGLQFQEYRLECMRAPDAWTGFDLEEIKEELASCDHITEAEERAELMFNMWGDPPDNSVAGVCIPLSENAE